MKGLLFMISLIAVCSALDPLEVTFETCPTDACPESILEVCYLDSFSWFIYELD
jgi:hypothetical protein